MRLRSETVIIWHVNLADHWAQHEYYLQILNATERQRADRIQTKRKRHEYIIVHALLRHCLANMLGESPQSLHLYLGEHGKPFLERTSSDHSFFFNVSHSYEQALIALAPEVEIGVDIEKIRPNIDILDLASRFFSPLEHQILLELPPWERLSAFFTCWARKEAVIKCEGTGVSLGLDQFDVSLRPAEPARLLRTAWRAEDAFNWSLLTLDINPRYRAALAARTRSLRVLTRPITPTSLAERIDFTRSDPYQ